MLTSDFALNWEKNATETMEVMEVILDRRQFGKTQFFEWFSKLKSCMTYIEDAKCMGSTVTSKTEENVDQMKEVFL